MPRPDGKTHLEATDDLLRAVREHSELARQYGPGEHSLTLDYANPAETKPVIEWLSATVSALTDVVRDLAETLDQLDPR
jgi:hypothetical protein